MKTRRNRFVSLLALLLTALMLLSLMGCGKKDDEDASTQRSKKPKKTTTSISASVTETTPLTNEGGTTTADAILSTADTTTGTTVGTDATSGSATDTTSDTTGTGTTTGSAIDTAGTTSATATSTTKKPTTTTTVRKVSVLNVVGTTKANAKALLEGQGFKVTVREEYHATVASGNVIRQSPAAGTSQAVGTTITVYVSKGKQPVTVTFNANGGQVSTNSKTVYVTSTYGSLPTPTRDYHKFDGWYTAASDGDKVTSTTQVSNTGAHTLYARWSEKPLSGWVLASNVPSGARVVEEKWTYTKTETTTSTSSSLSGWTQTGYTWKKTGEGSTYYATFPSGYDTGNTYYNSFARSAYSAYENENTKREVSSSWAGYVYWHWMYDCGGGNGKSTRTIYHKYGYGPDNGYLYKYFFAFTSTKGDYSSDTYYCNSQGIRNYIVTDQKTSAAECGGATRWFRFDYYVSSYTDYQKLYSYKKTTNLESTTQVTASGNISNVQKWVKYQAK